MPEKGENVASLFSPKNTQNLECSPIVHSRKLAATEKEDEVEEEVEGVGASGSDVSIDIEDEPVVFRI